MCSLFTLFFCYCCCSLTHSLLFKKKIKKKCACTVLYYFLIAPFDRRVGHLFCVFSIPRSSGNKSNQRQNVVHRMPFAHCLSVALFFCFVYYYYLTSLPSLFSCSCILLLRNSRFLLKKNMLTNRKEFQ